MDGTTFADFSIGKEYTRVVVFYFKGIFTFKIPFSNLSVTEFADDELSD